jgi:hypothetical protein
MASATVRILNGDFCAGAGLFVEVVATVGVLERVPRHELALTEVEFPEP